MNSITFAASNKKIMLKKIILVSYIFLLGLNAIAQEGVSYGINASVLFNSAILPDIEINTSISSVLNGDDVAKGVPQYADLTINYQFGGFVKYDNGFGFSMLETNYTTTRIHDEFTFNTGIFDEVSITTLDRRFAYLDLALSYNIYLSKTKSSYFSLGGGPSFLVSNTGNENPSKTDIRAFVGLGFNLSESVFISTKAELGISEVYKDSYIHHIMFPVSIGLKL